MKKNVTDRMYFFWYTLNVKNRKAPDFLIEDLEKSLRKKDFREARKLAVTIPSVSILDGTITSSFFFDDDIEYFTHSEAEKKAQSHKSK